MNIIKLFIISVIVLLVNISFARDIKWFVSEGKCIIGLQSIYAQNATKLSWNGECGQISNRAEGKGVLIFFQNDKRREYKGEMKFGLYNG